MAKGFLDAFAGDKLTAVSTAVQTPDRNSLTVEIMREVGIDISQQHAEDLAQSLDEIRQKVREFASQKLPSLPAQAAAAGMKS